jgi:hypothetical protein
MSEDGKSRAGGEDIVDSWKRKTRDATRSIASLGPVCPFRSHIQKLVCLMNLVAVVLYMHKEAIPSYIESQQ